MPEKEMRALDVGDVFYFEGEYVKVIQVEPGNVASFRNVTVDRIHSHRDYPRLLVNCGKMPVKVVEPYQVCSTPFQHGTYVHVPNDDDQCTMCDSMTKGTE